VHVLFLAPDTHIYNAGFVGGLKSIGARVSGMGLTPKTSLEPGLRRMLDGYDRIDRILDVDAVAQLATRLARQGGAFDLIETIDEPLVEIAASLRERLGIPGLSVRTATLCRDKVAMKQVMREHDLPCADSASVSSPQEAYAFAERVGFPLILKPVAGFGSLDTFRVGDKRELQVALQSLRVDSGARVAIEEYIEGHEGFFDTIVSESKVRHEFISHYFPGCLEAAQNRWISPQIVVTNRIEMDSYRELRAAGRRVNQALGIESGATHMEWFFGPKGLKISEIGARPAGEKIWDMYRVGNDFDVYREWARAVTGLPLEAEPSRRFAVGAVQVRPDGDGFVSGYSGLSKVWQRCRQEIYESQVPRIGTRTKPLNKGGLVNTWFRLRHPDYDELRRSLDFVGDTLRVYSSTAPPPQQG